VRVFLPRFAGLRPGLCESGRKATASGAKRPLNSASSGETGAADRERCALAVKPGGTNGIRPSHPPPRTRLRSAYSPGCSPPPWAPSQAPADDNRDRQQEVFSLRQITAEAAKHVRKRLEVYGLRAAEVRPADCEALPYPDNFFDLVYSVGVVHHTPDTKQASGEIVRVCRPGGSCKIMVYHRHSLVALFLWIRKALLAGRPWRSLAWCINHFVENSGTKAYTRPEIRAMLHEFPTVNVRVRSVLTTYDTLPGRPKFFQVVARVLAGLLGGDRVGWFLLVDLQKRTLDDTRIHAG